MVRKGTIFRKTCIICEKDNKRKGRKRRGITCSPKCSRTYVRIRNYIWQRLYRSKKCNDCKFIKKVKSFTDRGKKLNLCDDCLNKRFGAVE